MAEAMHSLLQPCMLTGAWVHSCFCVGQAWCAGCISCLSGVLHGAGNTCTAAVLAVG